MTMTTFRADQRVAQITTTIATCPLQSSRLIRAIMRAKPSKRNDPDHATA